MQMVLASYKKLVLQEVVALKVGVKVYLCRA
jgi:hypothetical protein